MLFDAGTNRGRVFQGFVDPWLVKTWLSSVGEQLICEIELYALVAIRHVLGSTFEGRKCIYWIDNNAARSVVIKGHSSSKAMSELAFRLSQVETFIALLLLDRASAELFKHSRLSVKASRKRDPEACAGPLRGAFSSGQGIHQIHAWQSSCEIGGVTKAWPLVCESLLLNCWMSGPNRVLSSGGVLVSGNCVARALETFGPLTRPPIAKTEKI